MLGKAIKELKLPRDEIVVLTKVRCRKQSLGVAHILPLLGLLSGRKGPGHAFHAYGLG